MTELVSLSRLNLLHPKLREDAVAAYKEAVDATPKGVHPFIVQGLRTFAESDDLYAQGRTKPGHIVTNAKGGRSLHNYGLAIDFALLIDKKIVWEVNKDWMTVVEIFKEHGWEWGGNWKSLKDNPHLQKTFGHTWRDLLVLHQECKEDKDGYVLI